MLYIKLERYDLALADFERVKQVSPAYPGIEEWLRRAKRASPMPPPPPAADRRSDSGKQDHYATLKVAPSADKDAVKRAYKMAALHWHPDKNLDRYEEAEEKFKEIQAAFQVLSDPAKRREYDISKGYATSASANPRPKGASKG